MFVAAVLVAVPFYVWAGDAVWFFIDEWQHLENRSLSLPGLMRPHNGHWSLVSALWFRVCFRVWGLATYLPYQIPVMLAHASACVVLRQLLVRSEVRGWIATAMGVALLGFGAGRDNILWAFQVGLTASLLCSFVQLRLTTGQKVSSRRDLAGLGVGAIGLTTSGVAIPATVMVGVVLWVRRGVRTAAAQTVPLALIYVGWFLWYLDERPQPLAPDSAEALAFIEGLGVTVFESLAGNGVGAIVLGGTAVLGVVAGSRLRPESRSVGGALPLGAFAGAVTFVGLTTWSRAEAFPDLASAPRYAHVLAFLGAPLVAAAAEWLARRHFAAALVPVLALGIGLPGNVAQMDDGLPYIWDPDYVYALAHSDRLLELDADHSLGSPLVPEPSAGWLRRARFDGRVPEPDPTDVVARLNAQRTLSVEVREGAATCPPVGRWRARITLGEGEAVAFSTPVQVRVVHGEDHRSGVERSTSPSGYVVALDGPIELEISSTEVGGPLELCDVEHTGRQNDG